MKFNLTKCEHLTVTNKRSPINSTYKFITIISKKCHLQKQQEEVDGELWVFLKFQKSPLTVSFAYDTSLNHLGKVWSVL